MDHLAILQMLKRLCFISNAKRHSAFKRAQTWENLMEDEWITNEQPIYLIQWELVNNEKRKLLKVFSPINIEIKCTNCISIKLIYTKYYSLLNANAESLAEVSSGFFFLALPSFESICSFTCPSSSSRFRFLGSDSPFALSVQLWMKDKTALCTFMQNYTSNKWYHSNKPVIVIKIDRPPP